MSQAAAMPTAMPAAMSASAVTASGVTVIPRNLRFVRESEAPPDAASWAGDRVTSAVFNALSLTFPDGERMFMDAVRNFKSLLSGVLLEQAQAFITQEAIHTREHVMLNKILDETHYPLEKIRAHIRYHTKIAEDLGPMAMLASTICLEHFTAMLGDLMLRTPQDQGVLAQTAPELRRLWQWHALEETEHKAVAFDVFMVATKDWSPLRRYWTRLHAMIIITLQFNNNIVKYAAQLLEADGDGWLAARAKVLWFLFGRPGFFRLGWRNYWSWFRPGFHPWDDDNRALMEQWREVFATAPSP